LKRENAPVKIRQPQAIASFLRAVADEWVFVGDTWLYTPTSIVEFGFADLIKNQSDDRRWPVLDSPIFGRFQEKLFSQLSIKNLWLPDRCEAVCVHG
jgi:hypothetical protein